MQIKKCFYYDKIIPGDNVLHELEINKKYPKIFPEFLNIEKNKNNDIIYNRKGVYNPKWDKTYLNKNLYIINKTDKNIWENNTRETNNNEYMFMTKEEMKKVEERIKQQTQINNPFCTFYWP